MAKLFAVLEGNIGGLDYAGIVEAVGESVPAGLKIGDRVAGFVDGGMLCCHICLSAM